MKCRSDFWNLCELFGKSDCFQFDFPENPQIYERFDIMAERRMFAKTIIDSDLFLDMPMSTQLLYFHLAMRADDDGFINNPKKIQRMVGCSDDDIRILISKQLIIPFDNGIVVIKHWRIHNYIRKDTYNETRYTEQKKSLVIDENKVYQLNEMSTECIPFVDEPSTERGRNVDDPSTQVRLGKVRLGKVRDNMSDKSDCTPPKSKKKIYGEYGKVKFTDEEYQRLCEDYSEKTISEYIRKIDEYLQMTGKKPYKDCNLAIRNWLNRDNIRKGNDQSGYEDDFSDLINNFD